MILLIKLLLAHLIGDFILQPRSWVTDKELRHHRSAKLYIHVLLHGILTWILVADPHFWAPVVVITVSHLIIDLAKVKFQKASTRTRWFFIDQLLHLLVIAGIWYWVIRPDFSPEVLIRVDVLMVTTAVVFLTNPASVVIRTMISQWTPDTLHGVNASLPDAGKYIGFIERIMVFTFILLNHWEAVGFLLAAKSVFRFGNLQESRDRKLTEYVLIGTLLSFAIAIGVALLTSAWVR